MFQYGIREIETSPVSPPGGPRTIMTGGGGVFTGQANVPDVTRCIRRCISKCTCASAWKAGILATKGQGSATSVNPRKLSNRKQRQPATKSATTLPACVACECQFDEYLYIFLRDPPPFVIAQHAFAHTRKLLLGPDHAYTESVLAICEATAQPQTAKGSVEH